MPYLPRLSSGTSLSVTVVEGGHNIIVGGVNIINICVYNYMPGESVRGTFKFKISKLLEMFPRGTLIHVWNYQPKNQRIGKFVIYSILFKSLGTLPKFYCLLDFKASLSRVG